MRCATIGPRSSSSTWACRTRTAWLLPELKRLSDAAILVLTSRDDERSKVAALDEGADDYVTKPFSIPELPGPDAHSTPPPRPGARRPPAVKTGELIIDLVHRRVARAGEEIKLSPKEWDILEQLALHAGRVVTHGQIWPSSGAAPPRPSSNICASTCASSARSSSPNPTARAGW